MLSVTRSRQPLSLQVGVLQGCQPVAEERGGLAVVPRGVKAGHCHSVLVLLSITLPHAQPTVQPSHA